MVSELFFYQLALIALLWLCCMLHWVWLSDHSTVPTPRPQPTPPRRTRHREPKPFAGLTTKPHCARSTAEQPSAPAMPATSPHTPSSHCAETATRSTFTRARPFFYSLEP